MKRMLLLCITLAASICSFSQVIFNAQLPPMGMTQKRQLWNFSLLNTTAGTVRVQVELQFIDIASNQRVFSALTSDVNVPKGLFQANAYNLGLINYTVLNSNYNVSMSPEGFLPIGNYTACYSVFLWKGDGLEKISENCEQVGIEPLSPAQLVQPADEEKLKTHHPLFTWTPPIPMVLFSDLNYDFKLVQVEPLQTPTDAVQLNAPLHQSSALRTNSLQYTAAFPKLDTGKISAWQVFVKNRETPVAQTTVWQFKIDGTQNQVASSRDYFTRMQQTQEMSYVISTGTISYLYENELNDKAVALQLYNITGASKSVVALTKSVDSLQYGSNYRQLLLEAGRLRDRNLYLLELTNSKREHWYLKFEYRKPD